MLSNLFPIGQVVVTAQDSYINSSSLPEKVLILEKDYDFVKPHRNNLSKKLYLERHSLQNTRITQLIDLCKIAAKENSVTDIIQASIAHIYNITEGSKIYLNIKQNSGGMHKLFRLNENLTVNEFSNYESIDSVIKKIDKFDRPIIIESKSILPLRLSGNKSHCLILPILHKSIMHGQFICLANSKIENINIMDIRIIEAWLDTLGIAIANFFLNDLVNIDYLTNLWSRRYFEKKLNLALEGVSPFKAFVYLSIDLDNFKLINDNYGHQIGDLVLTQVGKILLSLKKTNLIPARMGGEEFAVIAPVSSNGQALDIAIDIQNRFKKLNLLKRKKITCSIGLSFVQKNLEVNKLFYLTDKALYAAKEMGRNCIVNSQL